jgi:NAD(P)-dependent dehydrogenase (short-subunit alcohol dehydrogenase family)
MSRTVVVTGGAKGIGLAIAHRFTALGDHVIALGRDEHALNRLTDSLTGVTAHVCDVTDEDAVQMTFERLENIDVLVNNAGIAESAPLAATTLTDWRRHLDVNATGPFLCIRAALPQMKAHNTGSIITIASTAGRIGSPYTAAYTASKHAAVGLTRAVAAELAGTAVRANAVCPTFVRTELTDRAIENIVKRTGRTESQAEEALARSSPLGRLLEPHEVADAVVFLASDGAAAINGQALVIDGGGIQA